MYINIQIIILLLFLREANLIIERIQYILLYYIL